MIQRTSKAEQNRKAQSGPKHHKESSDLSRHLKAVSDADEVTLDGKLFHTHKAAISNAQSPMVKWHIGGMTSRYGC